MEYDERLAQFRQTRLNPFDRGEEDGQPGGKTPPQNGNVWGKKKKKNIRLERSSRNSFCIHVFSLTTLSLLGKKKIKNVHSVLIDEKEKSSSV